MFDAHSLNPDRKEQILRKNVGELRFTLLIRIILG